MKHFWKIFLIAFLCGGVCAAQTQPRSIHERILSHSSAIEHDVFSLVYNNPAMKSLMHNSTLTTVQLNGEYKKEDLPSVVQEGDGLRMGTVDVQSFIRKKNNSLWGQAYYKNGKKLGRCWNETSDYALLYPYVMGDTIGGDLKSEEYFFSGGYAYNTSKYIIGVEGAYKASIEYRNADPRPKNLTGDLKVKLGAAKYLSKHYLLGIMGYARKYKQTNDLAFYNELGVPNIYHFTGMGTDYYRFRGAKGESFYKGHAFGGSLELLQAKNKGISAAVQYNNFQFDKVISSLNELPMAEVKEDQLRSEIAWKQADNNPHQWGIKANVDYTRRQGRENIFGISTGNIFTQIDAQEKYMNKIYSGALTGVYEYTSAEKLRISVLPAVFYTDIHTTYILPHKDMKVSFIGTQMDVRVVYPIKKWMLHGEFGFVNRFNSQARLDIQPNLREGEENMNVPVRSNYEALSADSNGFHTTIRSDYSWNAKYSVYLAVNYQYIKDQRHSVAQSLSAHLGFVF